MSADFQPVKNNSLVAFGPEGALLVDRAWEMVRQDQSLSPDSSFAISGDRKQGHFLHWSSDQSAERDFEGAYFMIEGGEFTLFVCVDKPGLAVLEFAKKGEKSLIEFMTSFTLERKPLEECPAMTLDDLREAFNGVQLPPAWVEGLDPIAARAIRFDEQRLPPSVEIPVDAYLSDGQKQLLAELMVIGEELLLATSARAEDNTEYRPGREKGLSNMLDEVHISYQLACERKSIQEERIDLLNEVVGDLHAFLKDNTDFAESPEFERQEFELIVALAKARAVLEGIAMRVVSSESHEDTWSDFTVRSIHETLTYDEDDKDPTRFIILPPGDVKLALMK